MRSVIRKKISIAILAIVGLAINSAPLGAVSISNIPAKVAAGIVAGAKAGASLVKTGVVKTAGAVGSVVAKGASKTLGVVKVGAIKTKDLAKAGIIKTYGLAKKGASKLVPNKKNLKILASAAAVFAVLRFFSKRPSNDPSRFDYKKLSAKDPKETLNQVWYFIDDAIIGRAYRAPYVKYDKENDKLYIAKESTQIGFGGNLYLAFKTVSKAVSTAVAVGALKKGLTDGYGSWKDWTNDAVSVPMVVDDE